MKGTVVTRTLNDGSKRYHAVWRANGKQRWKTFHRRKDADLFLTGIVRSVHDGTYREVKPLLMNGVFDRWLSQWLEVQVKLGKPKPSTARTYRSIVRNHFRTAFGECRSDRLFSETVNEWVRGLAEKVGSIKLAPKSFNNIVTLLGSILSWARRPAQGFLRHDPLVDVKRLPRTRTEREFLEPTEIDALIGAAGATPPDDTILKVAAFTGLRRGELFGLQWGDVQWNSDGQDGKLYVRRSLYMGRIVTPKTTNSIRGIDIPQRLLGELTVYRAMFPPIESDFVFRNAKGRPIDADKWYKRRFIPILQRAGLRRVGLHALRHTYASMLINQGENVKYVSKQLGHSSVQLTIDLYSHLFRETSTAAMRRLEKQMGTSEQQAVSGNESMLSNDHLTERDETALKTADQQVATAQ